MFKVGDIVIFKNCNVSNITHQIDFITSIGFVCLDDVRGQFKQDDLQHATAEEIAAGHRIYKSPLMKHLDECEEVVKKWPKWKKESIRDAFGIPNLEPLRDCDTSPNCKKFDERVK